MLWVGSITDLGLVPVDYDGQTNQNIVYIGPEFRVEQIYNQYPFSREILPYIFIIWLWYDQVCDQPHPLLAQQIIKHCIAGNIDDAYTGLKQLYDLGYSATDIITTLFRVVKNYEMVEYLKLEYIRVSLVI